MTDSNALNSAFATARLHPAETVMGHDVTDCRVHFDIPLDVNATGGLSGEAHINGSQIAEMLGQTTVDLAHLKEIKFHSASSNVAAAVGAHFETGYGATRGTFATIDRATHVGGGALTACHVIVGPSCGTGAMTTSTNLGSIRCDFDHSELDRSNAMHAVGRAVRWAGTDHCKNIAGSCTSVGLDAANKRWLVPSDESKCSMSTLWAVNCNKDDFCGGRYSDGKATFAHDQQDRRCKVVTSEDFANVKAALVNRFAEKSPIRHGMTLRAATFGRDHAVLHKQLSDAGHPPRVTLSTSFVRTPSKEYFAQTPQPNRSVNRSDMHGFLGETDAAFARPAATTTESFAESILKLSLTGETSAIIAPSTTTPLLTAVVEPGLVTETAE